jgi:hypothetical protein
VSVNCHQCHSVVVWLPCIQPVFVPSSVAVSMHFSEDKPTKFSMLWLDTLFHGRFRSNMDRQIPLL